MDRAEMERLKRDLEALAERCKSAPERSIAHGEDYQRRHGEGKWPIAHGFLQAQIEDAAREAGLLAFRVGLYLAREENESAPVGATTEAR